MDSVERELKFRLPGEEEWLRMQTLLGQPSASLEQVNAYLDTPALSLAVGRGMLRLRREDGHRSLTYKRGVRVEEGYFEAREVESPVSEEDWDRLLAADERGLEHLAPLQALRADGILGPLAPCGEARNLRQQFPLATGDTLELDRTGFPNGRTDFEIEVETLHPAEVRALLEVLAARAGVALEVQDRTKYERFLEAAGLP